MTDVAKRGFELFEADLAAAWAEGAPDPIAAFESVGRTYLRFAREQPAYYSAMFESGLPPDRDAELREAGDRAFAVLRRASEAVCQILPAESRPPALMMSLHAWAMAHGIASLFGRGDAARRKLPMTPEELLEAEILIYLRGLGWGDHKPAKRR
jgi:hypothetical protein